MARASLHKKRRPLLTSEQIKLAMSIMDAEKEIINKMAIENEDYDPLWPEDQYDKSNRDKSK